MSLYWINIMEKLFNTIESIKAKWAALKSCAFSARLDYLLKNDPKPIFDHFRNVGIASAIIYGATFIQNTYYDPANHNVNLDLNTIAVTVMLLTGILLVIININYAQRSLAVFLFGDEHSNEVLSNICISLYKIVKNTYESKVITIDYWAPIFRYLFFQIIVGIYLLTVMFIGLTPMIEKYKMAQKNRTETFQNDLKLRILSERLDLLIENVAAVNAKLSFMHPTVKGAGR